MKIVSSKMPDLSFLTNYFDIPIAVNAVILFWASVQIFHMPVPTKLNSFKAYLSYIMLMQTAVEAVALMIFGIKGPEKSILFYIISAILLAIFLVYAFLLIKRNFPFTGRSKKSRRLFWLLYVLLFILMAVLPLILDLTNLVPYTSSYLYVYIILLLFYVYIFLRLRKQYQEGPFGLKLLMPVLGLEIILSIAVFFLGFFNLDQIADQADSMLNVKLLLVLIRSVLMVLISFLMGINLIRIARKDKLLKNLKNITFTFITIILVFITAFIVLVVFNTDNSFSSAYKEIDLQTDIITSGVDTKKLSNLTGTRDDLYSSDYYDIKAQLTETANAAENARYIYIYGLNNQDEVINYVETQPDSYTDTSSLFKPGDKYTEASAFLKNLFKTGSDGYEGPLADSYGVWYSEFDPLKLNDGRILILGSDFNAKDVLGSVYSERADTVAIMLFVFTLLVIAYDIYLVFGKTLSETEQSQLKFKSIFENSSDGILLMKENKIVDANKSASIFFGKTMSTLEGDTIVGLSPNKQDDGKSSDEKLKNIYEDFNNKKTASFGWKFLKDRQFIYADVSFNEFNVAGEKLIIALIRDITQKHLEDKEKQKYIGDLERLNKLMVGREVKMIELKEEIRNLKIKQ